MLPLRIMGERIVVTKSTQVRARFVCSVCGHRCDARVHAEGGGVGSIPVYEDTLEVAQREAERVATRDLEADATDALKLVRCPKCGKRSRSELGSLAAWTLLPMLLFGAIAYWMAQVFTIFGIVFGAAAFGMLILGVRTLSRAGRNVTFG